VRVAPGRRYFVTEAGEPFLVIGQNDALTWPELRGLIDRADLPGVEHHLAWLKAHGVTTLRVMLEYAGDGFYLEREPGQFEPATVQAIDDLVTLCERVGLRLLLTPFDTFFTYIDWEHHPYAACNGGPCERPLDLLLSPQGWEAVHRRLVFVVERWGGSGAVFAWDLWNELGADHGVPAERMPHEAQPDLYRFVTRSAELVRRIETQLWGRSHLLTVSHFMSTPRGALGDAIFRHPMLDFATTHIYQAGAIDDPRNTLKAADAMARWVKHALGEIRDGRPFTDSETGPIHAFKDLGITLPDGFDDTYFRHMAWAHLASGGCGGGMRWPNRDPHVLTPGMRHAQAILSEFAGLIDWTRFAARNVSDTLAARPENLLAYGCADDEQAVAWVLRDRDSLEDEGDCPYRPLLRDAEIGVPMPPDEVYRVTAVETARGHVLDERTIRATRHGLRIALPPFRHDVALAIRREQGGSGPDPSGR
jgi:mannan endo-1,4-beta-mannosidase